ncbi:MAG: ABC transporter substrate-binding protein, partial [Gammaproteobacteria bacterium]
MKIVLKSRVLLIGLFVFFLTACGGSGDDTPISELEAPDNTQEVQDYYASKPEFFSFKTLADLPPTLTWENGEHLAEIGSPNAKKGGTEYTQIQDFPRTLRTVGPDSNGSFRPWILDDTTMAIAHRHLDHFVFYPGLADSWAVDMDNKTVYVKLDVNAKWSDGMSVTADDFLFMFWFFQSQYIVAPW